jgi:hypothetical protein
MPVAAGEVPDQLRGHHAAQRLRHHPDRDHAARRHLQRQALRPGPCAPKAPCSRAGVHPQWTATPRRTDCGAGYRTEDPCGIPPVSWFTGVFGDHFAFPMTRPGRRSRAATGGRPGASRHSGTALSTNWRMSRSTISSSTGSSASTTRRGSARVSRQRRNGAGADPGGVHRTPGISPRVNLRSRTPSSRHCSEGAVVRQQGFAKPWGHQLPAATPAVATVTRCSSRRTRTRLLDSRSRTSHSCTGTWSSRLSA